MMAEKNETVEGKPKPQPKPENESKPKASPAVEDKTVEEEDESVVPAPNAENEHLARLVEKQSVGPDHATPQVERLVKKQSQVNE